MSKTYLVNETDLIAIADAIRAKNGTTETLTFPTDIVSAVENITTGAELNFDVVGGTTQPESPTENMIWVSTDTEIASRVFSAEEPTTPVEGMVWIETGTLSNVAFDIVKNVSAKIYPACVKQYISGAWVDVTAMTYQDGGWVDWLFYILSAIGGFTTTREDGTGTITVSDDGTITATTTGTGSNQQGNVGYFSDGVFDLSKYKTLSFHINASGFVYAAVGFFSANTSPYLWINNVAVQKFSIDTAGDYVVDLSGASGDCYFGIAMAGLENGSYGTDTVVVSNIALSY